MAITLEVTKRGEGESASSLRSADKLPAVVYGPKQESIALVVDHRAFEKAFKEGGESTIFNLTGLGEELEVLVHDVAFSAEKGGVIHVDFYAIERGKELTTNVPLEFVGDAPAEKAGGTVNKVLHEVEVTCRPSVLPAHITVDLSVLTDMDSQVRVADLALPEDVKVENAPEDVIANVAAQREEEPEEAAEAPDMDAIEVEAKGKTEGEGETKE